MADQNKTRIHYGALKPLLGPGNETKDSSSIQAAFAAGNINISTNERTEIVELSESSREAQDRHAKLLERVEAEKRARNLIVPTGINEIKHTLRAYGQPVTLFGENPAARRERLREFLARKEITQEEADKVYAKAMAVVQPSGATAPLPVSTTPAPPSVGEILIASLVPRGVGVQVIHGGEANAGGPLALPGTDEVLYTPANTALVEARERIARLSFNRAQTRLTGQRRKRIDQAAREADDLHAADVYTTVREMRITFSQFADERPVTCLRYSPNPQFCASGSWDSVAKVWDLKSFNSKALLQGHKERVVSLSWHPEALFFDEPEANSSHPLIATASADSTAKVWNAANGICKSTLRGHQARLSQVAFHPSGRFIGTTSYDHTWRFWDIECEKELLLQDGHDSETYAIAFQGDGALVATGDLKGIGRLWDLRSGKFVWNLLGHVKRLLCADFSPNGFILATGSDDNTARIWDLRKQACAYNLPAHSALITDLKYAPTSGEYLVTSSFDNTAKVWSTRNWSLLRILAGHEGKVTAADISPSEKHIITASFDRTFKLWAHKDEF